MLYFAQYARIAPIITIRASAGGPEEIAFMPNRQSLEEKLHAFCQQQNLKPGDLNHILRVATTGVTIGPGVFDCLAILGRQETLRRLDMALKLVEEG